jgi:hypothetical protein
MLHGFNRFPVTFILDMNSLGVFQFFQKKCLTNMGKGI